ncbi:ATP-dependent helicase [Entomoplasma freundtii]|nr:UvrD-helicase domain-containing protein [Entomoplasma freundtii]
MTKLLENLNKQQRQAVEIVDSPLRIVAGAGSGKTRVITTKIAYLIDHVGIKSTKILALTFTNKAAREMKDRVQKILQNEALNPFISTFHSFCARVLREEAPILNLPKHFNILDTADQRTILRQLIKAHDLSPEINVVKFEKKALGQISDWKNGLLSPDDVLETSANPDDREVAKLYKLYDERLRSEKALDFDDLQVYTYHLFSNYPEVLEKWRKRFDYVMVDEFQDTNDLQFELIRFLTKGRNDLTVVGDPDQTIYSWRGARVEIITNFQKYYPNAKTIVLNENYRSTQQILDLANDFIEQNHHREKKLIFTQNLGGKRPEVKEAASRYAEARYITSMIEKMVKNDGYQYNDFFILYRANYWSQEFEKVLTNAKIPYQLVGAIKFRERKVIKDAMAFLKVILLQDNLSMERLLHLTPKVGEVTQQKLTLLAQEKGLNLYEVVTSPENEALAVTKHLETLRNALIQGEQLANNQAPVTQILETLLDLSGYWEQVKILDNDEKDNQNHLKALLDQVQRFDDEFDPERYGESNPLLAFLQEEALTSGDDNQQEPNKVTLLTIHSAKGLENKVVFIAGVNQDVFPSRFSMMRTDSLEEERRALYVAMTRAKERLILSYVQGEYSRLSNGLLQASRFIRELNQDLIDIERNIFVHNDGVITSQPASTKTMAASEFQKGDLVNHILFGDGIVIKVYETEYQIAFNNPKFGVQILVKGNPVLRKKI